MNKVLKIITIIGLIVLNQSCNQNNIIEINHFADGQKATSYGKNGIVDSIIIEKGNIKISKFISKSNEKDNNFFKVYFYDTKGNVTSEGDMNHNNKVGNWLYFKNQQLIKKEEYFRICEKNVINQVWQYDSKNKIDLNKSSFYTYKFTDTIIEKENLKVLKIKFSPSKLIEVDKIRFYTSSKIQGDFCNLNNLKLIDIPKNKQNEYEIAFERDDKFDTIKGYFTEEFRVNSKSKEKYTLVKIPFK
ncbi:hypothetical protein [Flavobacterium covae]|uniref:hypothetical protein n=1 Tax=Flavobacterium covae TaxID=2906076 RepID=UPI0033967139